MTVPASVRRTAAAAILTLLAATATAASAQEAPATPSREQLQQRLETQRAANERMKARIDKLEAKLKEDVCADPASAQALLNAAEPTPAAP